MKRRSFFKGLLITAAAAITPNVLASRKIIKEATQQFPAMLPPGCRSYVTTILGKSGMSREIKHGLNTCFVTALAYSRDERWMTTVPVEVIDVNAIKVHVNFPGLRVADDAMLCSVIVVATDKRHFPTSDFMIPMHVKHPTCQDEARFRSACFKSIKPS